MDHKQIVLDVLVRHGSGGWMYNGNATKCKCYCGYKPQLGEYYGNHVADDIVASLGL